MLSSARLLNAKIFHKREHPRQNRFGYGLLYLAIPLSRIDSLNLGPLFGVNRAALMSFWNKDHGDRSGSSLKAWADRVLISQGVEDVDGEIVLVTLPRLLGYVFNPVSFWLCHRKDGSLRAVIAEVNNTFGETHSYVCAGETGESITQTQRFFAEKEFHVSPFFKRDGSYRFKFQTSADSLTINIDYFDDQENLQLKTSIAGSYSEWTGRGLLRGWLSSPLMALKAISLIHWQALKLLVKSAKFQSKPEQHQWFLTKARIGLDNNKQLIN